MKTTNEQSLKRNKGITLIALVITKLVQVA